MAELTHDAILGGRVRLTQPARGYRVNADAILLAAFAARHLAPPARPPRARPARFVVDLGAGVGAVGLSALALGAAARVTLVDVDRAAAELARRNAADNGWADRVDVVNAHVTAASEALSGRADLVVCNPPYVEPGRGRPPSAAKARARSGSLDVFVTAARVVLGRRGRACFVYPAIEAATLFALLRKSGLEPKRVSFVHPTPGAAARVVLVEAVAGKPGGLCVAPPVVERDARGAPDAALARILRGDVAA